MLCFLSHAQAFTEKALQQSVLQINTAKTANDYDNLFKKFSESKTSEKWQAYYYAAVALYLKTELQLKTTSAQSLAGTNALARKWATGAWSSQQDNAEANTLLGLLYFQKIQINAQDAQKDSDVISQTIAKAEASSPNNPRLTILKARVKEKSGDKANAEILYEKALSELENEKSSEGIAPTWGRQLIQSTK